MQNLVELLIKGLFPGLFNNFLSGLASYRSFILPLNQDINADLLWNSLNENLVLGTNWHQEPQAEFNWQMARNKELIRYLNANGRLLRVVRYSVQQTTIVNYGQYVWICMIENIKGGHELLVHTEFTKPQFIERGLLTKNIEAIITILDKYWVENISIETSVRSLAKIYFPDENKSGIVIILFIVLLLAVTLGWYFMFPY